VLLVICGGFLRLWNLGGQSFWVDEVDALYAAKSWLDTGTFAMPSGYIYTRAPLYTYATGLLYTVLGVSETTTRLTSAVFGILSILLTYALGKRIFNRNVGLLSAFLMTFSHFEVGWSRTARMYTLLQCLTLVFIYAFIRGFEALSGSDATASSSLSRIKQRLREWRIAPLWLVLGAVVLVVSFLYAHYLTIFIPGSIFLYCLTMSVLRFFEKRGPERLWNKYSVVSALGVVVFLVLYLIPYTRGAASYFLSYTPAWATGLSSAQNPMVLFEFLISSQRFPLAAFFFIGSLQVISRKNTLGWIPFWAFLFPVIILSFVFTHRVSTYMLHVYPFFLMLSAFGFLNLLGSEKDVLEKAHVFNKRWLRTVFLAMFFGIFLISPWLRITLHIPFLEDGKTNLAVTSEEWREAARILNVHQQKGDLIITSLPQVAMYYGIRSDYCLNLNSLKQSQEQRFVNAQGQYIDVYAGVVCIVSLEALKDILGSHPRGWLLISRYNLEHVNYTPERVRDFITGTLDNPMQTKNGTLLIYRWPQERGES
jgi:uncharacterized membrane protein